MTIIFFGALKLSIITMFSAALALWLGAVGLGVPGTWICQNGCLRSVDCEDLGYPRSTCWDSIPHLLWCGTCTKSTQVPNLTTTTMKPNYPNQSTPVPPPYPFFNLSGIGGPLLYLVQMFNFGDDKNFTQQDVETFFNQSGSQTVLTQQGRRSSSGGVSGLIRKIMGWNVTDHSELSNDTVLG